VGPEGVVYRKEKNEEEEEGDARRKRWLVGC
jgi:hypothetical protein